jgi:protein translocase SEC61 complex gamma subunit
VNKCEKPDAKEFFKVLRVTGFGFVCIGLIGFFVKVIFIPINQVGGCRLAQPAPESCDPTPAVAPRRSSSARPPTHSMADAPLGGSWVAAPRARRPIAAQRCVQPHIALTAESADYAAAALLHCC